MRKSKYIPETYANNFRKSSGSPAAMAIDSSVGTG